jgi:hypothetical protein
MFILPLIDFALEFDNTAARLFVPALATSKSCFEELFSAGQRFPGFVLE